MEPLAAGNAPVLARGGEEPVVARLGFAGRDCGRAGFGRRRFRLRLRRGGPDRGLDGFERVQRAPDSLDARLLRPPGGRGRHEPRIGPAPLADRHVPDRPPPPPAAGELLQISDRDPAALRQQTPVKRIVLHVGPRGFQHRPRRPQVRPEPGVHRNRRVAFLAPPPLPCGKRPVEPPARLSQPLHRGSVPDLDLAVADAERQVRQYPVPRIVRRHPARRIMGGLATDRPEHRFLHPRRHVVGGSLLAPLARPRPRQMIGDLRVRHRIAGDVLAAPRPDRRLDRRAVDVYVEPVAVPCRRRVDRLARGPPVGQQEAAVDGQPLGARYGQRVAVIETHPAVPVDDLVVVERDDPPMIGAPPDPHPGRAAPDPRRAFLHIEHGEHGAVEELLLPVRRADPQTVARRDLQRLGFCLWVAPPARLYRDPGSVRIGQHALAHQEGERPGLGVGLRDHRRRSVGILLPVLVPVVDQPGEGAVEVAPEMEPPARRMGRDAGRRVAVPERLRGRDLPRLDAHPVHVGESLVRRHRLGTLRFRHRLCPAARLLPGLSVEPDQRVLGVGPLAAHRVHPHRAHDIAHQPEARTRRHRLLLLRVPRQNQLRATRAREVEDLLRMGRGQHPRLVDEDDRLSVHRRPAPGGHGEQLVDAERVRVEVAPELQRGAPRDRGGDHAVPPLPVEVGDGPQRRGLPAARRALDDGHPPPGGGGADGRALLVRQRMASGAELFQLPGHFGRGDGIAAGLLQRACGVVDAALGVEVAGRGVGAGVDQRSRRVGRGFGPVEADDLLARQHAPERGFPLLAGQQPARRVGGPAHEVVVVEHSFHLRHPLGKLLQSAGNLGTLLPGDLSRLADGRADERVDLGDDAARVLAPDAVAFLGVEPVLLGRPRHPLHRRVERSVALKRYPEPRRRAVDLRVALRPFPDQFLRGLPDAGVLPLLSVHLHRDAEPRAQQPGELGPVHRAGRLLPGEQRMPVQRAPLPVMVGAGDVEDHAVGVEMRVVRPCRAVPEQRRREVGGDRLDRPFPVADPGIRAVPEHDVLQRHSHRVVMGLLDPFTEIGRRDRPEGGDRLVGVEEEVVARAALRAPGVPRQLLPGGGMEAVVEKVEVGGIHGPAVPHPGPALPEQAGGVPPHPVGLLAREIVFLDRPVGGLGVDVVVRAGGGCDGGDHGTGAFGDTEDRLRGSGRKAQSTSSARVQGDYF